MAAKDVSKNPGEAGFMPEPNQAMGYGRGVLEDLFDKASAANVYGRPIKQGDVTVIPAAEVTAAAGFAGGYGYGPVETGGEGDHSAGGGVGVGGGGRAFSRPVAVVVVTPQGVRVEPVIDPSKILLAAITAGGFMAAMVMRMLKPESAAKQLKKT